MLHTHAPNTAEEKVQDRTGCRSWVEKGSSTAAPPPCSLSPPALQPCRLSSIMHQFPVHIVVLFLSSPKKESTSPGTVGHSSPVVRGWLQKKSIALPEMVGALFGDEGFTTRTSTSSSCHKSLVQFWVSSMEHGAWILVVGAEQGWQCTRPLFLDAGDEKVQRNFFGTCQ